MLAFKRAL
jgi:pyruvate/2-oxoglutarate dehydrogenase complex dihydrolipoamide acyltransferase (E2) component